MATVMLIWRSFEENNWRKTPKMWQKNAVTKKLRDDTRDFVRNRPYFWVTLHLRFKMNPRAKLSYGKEFDLRNIFSSVNGFVRRLVLMDREAKANEEVVYWFAFRNRSACLETSVPQNDDRIFEASSRKIPCRYLSILRSTSSPGVAFVMRWKNRDPWPGTTTFRFWIAL